MQRIDLGSKIQTYPKFAILQYDKKSVVITFFIFFFFSFFKFYLFCSLSIPVIKILIRHIVFEICRTRKKNNVNSLICFFYSNDLYLCTQDRVDNKTYMVAS